MVVPELQNSCSAPRTRTSDLHFSSPHLRIPFLFDPSPSALQYLSVPVCVVRCVSLLGLHPREEPSLANCKGFASRGPRKDRARFIKWRGLTPRKMSCSFINCPKQSQKPGRTPDGLCECVHLETLQQVMFSCNKYRRELGFLVCSLELSTCEERSFEISPVYWILCDSMKFSGRL